MNTPNTLMVPMVNMNGNSRDSLVNEIETAWHAINHAAQQVQVLDYTNGRNFQTHPQGQSAAMVAQDQKGVMVKALRDMALQLGDLMVAIDQQGRR